MLKFLLVSSLLCIAMPAIASTMILCRHPGLEDVVITLAQRKAFHHTLDCISGNFIADVTPCAPDGGFGLSAPTGSADLIGVVMRWQDYSNHFGPVTGHFVTSDKISFSEGFMGSDGFKQEWDFDVSRLTGSGVLRVAGKADVDFSCDKMRKRF